MRNISQKIFPVLRKLRKKIAQNSLRFMRKNSAKVREKQNLRKRFSHFVETLIMHTDNTTYMQYSISYIQTRQHNNNIVYYTYKLYNIHTILYIIHIDYTVYNKHTILYIIHKDYTTYMQYSISCKHTM